MESYSIINLILIAILVIITAYYAFQTRNLTRISQITLLYQRKPHFITKVENEGNGIFCTIKNDEKSISVVKKVVVKLYMLLGKRKLNIGKYHIDGPLLPGEGDYIDITSLVRNKLKNLKLMSSFTEQIPAVDELGRDYMYDEEYFDISKREITFDIVMETTLELDVEQIPDRSITQTRIFVVVLKSSPFGFSDPYSDSYETNIKMKMGKWVK